MGTQNIQPPKGKFSTSGTQSKMTRRRMMKSMVHDEEGTPSNETNPELTQMLELAGKDTFSKLLL